MIPISFPISRAIFASSFGKSGTKLPRCITATWDAHLSTGADQRANDGDIGASRWIGRWTAEIGSVILQWTEIFSRVVNCLLGRVLNRRWAGGTSRRGGRPMAGRLIRVPTASNGSWREAQFFFFVVERTVNRVGEMHPWITVRVRDNWNLRACDRGRRWVAPTIGPSGCPRGRRDAGSRHAWYWRVDAKLGTPTNGKLQKQVCRQATLVLAGKL